MSTSTYTLLTGKHSRFENGEPVVYGAGDALELTDEEAAGESLSGRVERIREEPEAKPATKARKGAKKKAAR